MSHIDEGELTAYADGAYSPDDEQAKRITAHLSTCENCRNRLLQAQQLNARASEILSVATPVNIAMPPLPRVRRNFWIPTAWAASIVLALGLGYWAHETPVQVPVNAPAAPTPAVAVAPPENKPAPKVETVTKPAQLAEPARTLAPAPAPPPPEAASPAADALALDAKVQQVDSSGVTEQTLADGKVITIIRERLEPQSFRREAAKSSFAAGNQAAAPPPVVVPSFTTIRGSYRVTVKGPLPLDSLRAIAARLK